VAKLEPRVYYKEGKVIVRSSVLEDVQKLSKTLRSSDIQEIWDSHHHTPKTALDVSIEESLVCLTVEKEGEPIAMFGIHPIEVLGSKAIIWMLGSQELDTIGVRFIRRSRRFIDMFLEYYPFLYNYVSTENMPSLQWLRWLGASFKRPERYGIEQKPFQYFWFERK
jgi:hypothetical protein